MPDYSPVLFVIACLVLTVSLGVNAFFIRALVESIARIERKLEGFVQKWNDAIGGLTTRLAIIEDRSKRRRASDALEDPES